ncbi:MAG: 2-phosphosulfolactate phosphatase [Gemmatimonadota bacterium]|nr:2-phosphosulfolactate phosphatase [Gemmatimonadota bacterium]
MARFIGIGECESVSGAAVVIDVMRAYTVAAWALHLGAARMILVDDLDVALELKSRFPGSLALKDGAPAEGFDLYNSPADLQEADIRGKTIVQRTTAGTIGAVAVRHCRPLICTGFVCASAVARRLRDLAPDELTYVVTGEDGTAEEDLACAEYIDALVRNPDTDHAPYIQRASESKAAIDILQAAAEGYTGINPRDVDMCVDVNRFDFTLEASVEDELLVLRKHQV